MSKKFKISKNKLFFKNKNGSLMRLDKYSLDLYYFVISRMTTEEFVKKHKALNDGVKYAMNVSPVLLHVPDPLSGYVENSPTQNRVHDKGKVHHTMTIFTQIDRVAVVKLTTEKNILELSNDEKIINSVVETDKENS